MKPIVVIAGIMDTKGKELFFIRDRVQEMGCETLVVEFSLGKEVKDTRIDVGIRSLLSLVDRTPEDIFALTRGEAAKIVTDAALLFFKLLVDQKQIHGMIAYGGGMGSSIAAPVMQSLPYGMPKILLSTMVHCAEQYLAYKDIAMLFSVTEAGLNRISRNILNTAAGIVVGGAQAYYSYDARDTTPLIAVTMQGVTTPCAEEVAHSLESGKDFDAMIIHANGEGGKTLEHMIREKCFDAVADITTGELSATLLHGINDATIDRLNGAIECGIPQVVSTGSLDFSSFRNRDAMGKQLLDEESAGVPGRRTHYHNTNCTVCTITPKEAYTQGLLFAEKLNHARAKTCLLVPLRGWSAYDIAAPDIALGWAGPGPGPSWICDPHDPIHSLRIRKFLDGFLCRADIGNSYLECYTCDCHINDPAFAECFSSLLMYVTTDKQPVHSSGLGMTRIF